jgi:hypothetical protein
MLLDYNSIASLVLNLNGFILSDVSPYASTFTDGRLPTLDKSHLAFQRAIYVNFRLSRFERIYLLNQTESGVQFTFGDTLLIGIEYSTPVMIFHPAPLLVLRTNVLYNSTARYAFGNNSRTLVYCYTIQRNDSIAVLDIVDTRYAPYNTVDVDHSYALMSYDNFRDQVYATPLNTVYMSSMVSRIPIGTAMALPGAQGSLSYNSTVQLNIQRPTINNVTALCGNGSYNHFIPIVIAVQFSSRVIVQGCPALLFILNNIETYAVYDQGSGSNTLYFVYNISAENAAFNLDYYSIYSFKLLACGSGVGQEIFVKRWASIPSIDANLTMPLVNRVLTIISPRSILGNQQNITLSNSAAYVQSISTTQHGQVLSLGDRVDVQVTFTQSIRVEDVYAQLQLIYFQSRMYNRIVDAIIGSDYARYRTADYSKQPNRSSIQFSSIVHAFDSIDNLRTTIHSVFNSVLANQPNASYSTSSMFGLSYDGPFAILTSSACAFLDRYGGCAAQNLPPVSISGLQQQDELTSQHIFISHAFAVPATTLLHIEQQTMNSGELLVILCSFDMDVYVQGRPQLVLHLDSANGSSSLLIADYQEMRNGSLVFTVLLSTASIESITCDQRCFLSLQFGQIYKVANFLPILQADVSLLRLQVSESIPVTIDTPFVRRVYSNITEVLSTNDTVYIFVEFSKPIKVFGVPALLLDAAQNRSLPRGQWPTALFHRLHDPCTLLLTYKVRPLDRASVLDYFDSNSLTVRSNGSIVYDGLVYSLPGIYSASPYTNQAADLTLPARGSRLSLGRQSNVLVDQLRPSLLSIYSFQDVYACGETVLIVLTFNEPIYAYNYIPGTIHLQLRLSSYNNIIADSYPFATLQNITDSSLFFSYTLSRADSDGEVSLRSRFPIALPSQTQLLSISTDLPIAYAVSESIRGNFSLSVNNSAPYVLRVYCSNTNSNRAEPSSAGAILFILVQYSAPIRVVDTSAIKLNLRFEDDVIHQAVYSSYSGDTLWLTYQVQAGDKAERLEYASMDALTGTIYAASACDIPILVNNLLPVLFSKLSLFASAVTIDSTPPYILQLIPLKAPGSYGENEEIYILARFSRAVVVLGYPVLRLDTGHPDGFQLANYTSSLPYDDVSLVFTDADVLFKYIVQADDSTDDLQHSGPDAFIVSNASRLLAQASRPTSNVNMALREPGDFILVEGIVAQQWMYRFPYKLDLFVRELSVPDLRALDMTLYHNALHSPLVSTVSSAMYSNANTKSVAHRASAGMQPLLDSIIPLGAGVGEDLQFSDSDARNIAPLAVANQSTTLQSPYLAIDGNCSPLISDNSVSETLAEQDPWFVLALHERSNVSSISIFERKPEQWLEPIVDVTIKAMGLLPPGFFKLTFSNLQNTGKRKHH